MIPGICTGPRLQVCTPRISRKLIARMRWSGYTLDSVPNNNNHNHKQQQHVPQIMEKSWKLSNFCDEEQIVASRATDHGGEQIVASRATDHGGRCPCCAGSCGSSFGHGR